MGKTVALILFVAMYVLLLSLPKWRPYISLTTAALFVILGILPLSAVPGAIDWNVLLMIAGTMGTVWLFIRSQMPALLADKLIERMPNVKWATVALAVFAGVVSAFVDNVATVLMVAPVAIAIAKKLEISPVPLVISIAVFSNLQGMATLVGDTTSILLGGYADMNFLDFFFFQGKLGLFFVVQISCVLAALVLLVILRGYNQPISQKGNTKVTDLFPTYLLVGTVLLLICASFIPEKPAVTNGLICTALFIIGLVREIIKTREEGLVKSAMGEIDWNTLALLAGLFVVIAGITEAGIIDDISRIFTKIGGDSVFLIYTLLVWFSVLISAFIDNIPYVATMLPVAVGIAQIMGVSPYILYLGIMTGATLGGNLTPIGASANITAIGILRKQGHEVPTKDFLRIGVPSTLTAVISGYLLIWLIYA